VRHGRSAIPFVALALLVAPGAGRRVHGAQAASAATKPALENASASVEALIDRFLDALAKKDREALRSLRVTESEYRTLIMPGAVPPGSPLRNYPDDVSEYFWSVMNTKSAYYESYLVNTIGGRHFMATGFSWANGTQDYATHTAFKQLRLTVEDGDGHEDEVKTGSVVKVGDCYKFMSFIRD
jgi:hypothetical protein